MKNENSANKITREVLEGRTLTSVAMDYNTNASAIWNVVHAECKRRNPRMYAMGERDRLLGLKKPKPPSTAYLRRHKEAFLDAPVVKDQ